jgi:hypothetical protein
MCSAKKLKEEEDTFCAQLRNDTFQTKKALKRGDELYADHQKNMDSLKIIIMMKERNVPCSFLEPDGFKKWTIYIVFDICRTDFKPSNKIRIEPSENK